MPTNQWPVKLMTLFFHLDQNWVTPTHKMKDWLKITCSQPTPYRTRDIINMLSRRATGFHRWAKLLKLNFFVRKRSARSSKLASKIVFTASQFYWHPALSETSGRTFWLPNPTKSNFVNEINCGIIYIFIDLFLKNSTKSSIVNIILICFPLLS